jgi:hypothetical protein
MDGDAIHRRCHGGKVAISQVVDVYLLNIFDVFTASERDIVAC